MMHEGNIRNIQNPTGKDRANFQPMAAGWPANSDVPRTGTAVDLSDPTEIPSMAFLRNPLFWEKKIKIAVLTLATFMALC
jgi:hypothetical protein